MNKFAPSLAAALACAATLTAQTTPAYLNPSLPAAQRAHDLVSRMTLDEKATQLEDWAVAIPRLGIPDYQTWSEALHGVANSGYATVFPQAIGMAATWDPKLVQREGDIISTEARAKYNQAQREGNHRIFYGLTFWSPNINIFRDPRWGRGQETYGEDPFLTASVANAFIGGVQGPDPAHPKAVATSKHYAVHSGPESQRHTFNVDVSPRDLEETYLAAFRSTVVDGHVKSVMCAYNAIDGHSACDNTMLLKDHLRDAWKFDGFVVSDCGAIVDVTRGHHDAPDITHAAAISLQAGTDLSCSIWSPGFNKLADAVHQGLVTEDLVTQAAERLYTARFELGMFDPPGSSALDKIPFSEATSDDHRAVALQAAEESMVLLKNGNHALPLAKTVHSIAVVGPTADLLVSLEGNYNGQAFHPVTPLDGIHQQFPSAAIHYAEGSTLADGVGVPVPRTAFPAGLHTEFFATPDWTGRPAAVSTEPRIQYDWRDETPRPEILTHDYSVRWTGKLRAPAAGQYTFILDSGSGFPYAPKEAYRFTLDGKVLKEGVLNPGKSNAGNGSQTGASPTAPPVMSFARAAEIPLDLDTSEHDLIVEYSHSGDLAGGGVTLNWKAPPSALIEEAVAAAHASDVVIAFTGLSPQLEGEEMPLKIEGFAGGDRTSIDLPAAQQKLLESVAATGKPVIVVNLSGSAVALRWANEHAAAILQAWYPGVDGGKAIARTLSGDNNPAGRLPVTFYASTEDLPPFTDYSMKNRTYKYYQGKPLWGFGYGLSYSTFHYGPIHMSAHSATVNVKNTSARAGDEVVEAFVKTPQTDGPIRSLAAFERIHLAPGESRDVTLRLSDRALSSVDDKGDRSILPGTYHLTIGSTQTDFTIQSATPLPK
jgi:beta-glucosidase